MTDLPENVRILGPLGPGYGAILTRPALQFVADLHRRFAGRIDELLRLRAGRRHALASGKRLHFLAETAAIREDDWTVAPLPGDLLDRRVEITGPVDRKMIINALSSGASVFMADFEDSNSPTWDNCVSGQINLFDAVRRTITWDHPTTGKHYALGDSVATLMVRPRGLHLLEKHVEVGGAPVPASLFDFGLFVFHSGRELLSRGSGPYFYLPKLESHLEAKLWDDVFVAAQEGLEIPLGSVKATVLIETLPAAFEMDEILFALRRHSAGLNCGRWDYIFSMIKTMSADPGFVMPDRAAVGMTQHCMRSYSQLVIKTCHRRGVHAMGGMAAQIPIKRDPVANAAALEKVRADKLREAGDGHDGTWVAHPALVPLARQVFDAQMPGPHQLHRARLDVDVTADDLLTVPTGPRTEAGLRQNVNVGLLYLEAWIRGNGCVPLYDLMEDAATAEISRTQLWQWIRHGARLDDGRLVTRELVAQTLDEELAVIREYVGDAAFEGGRFDDARRLFETVATSETLVEFLTLPAYDELVRDTLL